MFKVQLGPGVSTEEWGRLRTEVAQAAGNALGAYGRHGGRFALRNAAYTVNNVDPVANWEMALNDPEQMKPETVVGAVESAIGNAQRLQSEATERERGITGVVAAFLRWPADLREAVGPGSSAQRRAAGVVGVVAQGAVAAALGTALVGTAVLVWHAIAAAL